MLAGGHSLLPVMKLRLAAPELMIDIGRLERAAVHRGSTATRSRSGRGPGTATLETSERAGDRVPLLPAVARTVGDPQVRHRGTLGGSLAHADPASDLPAAVLALGGDGRAARPAGRAARCRSTEFYTGVFCTVKEPDELIIEIRVPRTGAAGWAYEKFVRRANDWAIVAVAVVDGRVGLVNMGPTPLRASATEAALARGASIAEAAALADQGTDPPADLAATREYRRHLARVLTRRALTTAHDR